MKIYQLSVFLENRPGALVEPIRLLAAAQINLDVIVLADSTEFGILRLIIRDWRCALDLLQSAGCAVNVVELVAVGAVDEPGGLARVLEAIEPAGVNVEYMFGFGRAQGGAAALMLRFDDPDRALAALAEAKIDILSIDDLLPQED